MLESYAAVFLARETISEKIKRLVEMELKVIDEHQRNIEVLKDLINQRYKVICNLYDECSGHTFENQKGNGEYEMGCKNCGMTL